MFYLVNVTIVTHKFGNYQFSTSDEEMHNAIDKVLHKIDVKINREKSKIKEQTKGSREEVVEFFFNHEEDKAEPSLEVVVDSKPTEIIDAYLQMKSSDMDYFGFTLVDGLQSAFLRRIGEDVFHLFKSTSDAVYGELPVIFEGESVTV